MIFFLYLKTSHEDVRPAYETVYTKHVPETTPQAVADQYMRKTPGPKYMRRTPEHLTNPQDSYMKNTQDQFPRRPPSNPRTFSSQPLYPHETWQDDGRDMRLRMEEGRERRNYSPSFSSFDSQVIYFYLI